MFEVPKQAQRVLRQMSKKAGVAFDTPELIDFDTEKLDSNTVYCELFNNVYGKDFRFLQEAELDLREMAGVARARFYSPFTLQHMQPQSIVPGVLFAEAIGHLGGATILYKQNESVSVQPRLCSSFIEAKEGVPTHAEVTILTFVLRARGKAPFTILGCVLYQDKVVAQGFCTGHAINPETNQVVEF